MKIKEKIFKLIRPLFVKDIDPNEDFYCGNCGKPVLTRILFCSQECDDEFTREGKCRR